MLVFSGDLSLHVDLRYKCLGFHDTQGHIKLAYHAKSLCGHEVKDWSLGGREDGSVERACYTRVRTELRSPEPTLQGDVVVPVLGRWRQEMPRAH